MVRGRILIGILCILFAGAVVFGEAEPGKAAVGKKDAKVKTDFKFSDLKVERVEDAIDLTDQSHRAKYVAKFAINPEIDLASQYPHGAIKYGFRGKNLIYRLHLAHVEKMLDVPTYEELSSEQKELVNAGYALYRTRGNEFFILGVDEEQTLKTVKAFFEFLVKRNEKTHKEAVEYVQEAEEKLQVFGLESRKKKIEDAKEALRDVKKRTRTFYQDGDQASKAIERMNKIVEDTEIEMDAILAKTKVLEQEYERIKDKIAKKESKPDALLKLEELRFELNMSGAGCNATLEKAYDIRACADLYLELYQKFTEVRESYNNLLKRKDYGMARARLNGAKQKADELAEMVKFEVEDNKIVICPVE